MTDTILTTSAYRENLYMLLSDIMPESNREVTMGNMTRWSIRFSGDAPIALRAVIPMDLLNTNPLARGAIRELAVDILESLYSDATNNDICRVAIFETSAHFESYESLSEFAELPFASVVVIDAEMEDYLS